MSFMEKVAEAPNQREATLLLAGALDIILAAIIEQRPADDWEADWTVGGSPGYPELLAVDPPEQYGQGAVAREPAKPLERDGADWVIPPASPELQMARHGWARANLIGITAGSGDELAAANTGTSLNDLINAYVKGGPEWLTAYDTEYVQTLPPSAKQTMAEDYEQRGLRQEALEFSVAFLQGDATSMATVVPTADTLPGAPR